MRTTETAGRAHYKGYEYRTRVLAEVRQGDNGDTSIPKADVLDAAIKANDDPRRGNQNRVLDRGELTSGFKSLIARRRAKAPEWYGSTVEAGKKLDPTLAHAMLYHRIIQILDDELTPTTRAPASRFRTQLLDARDDHRGLFNAVIPLSEGGDPNVAKNYYIERKMPGERGLLYGPFKMPEAGLPEGENPIIALSAFQVSPKKASFTFDTGVMRGNWQHTVDKIRVDEDTRTVTIPFRVYRPQSEPILNGTLSYNGGDFALGTGKWKVELVDAITSRVLKRTQLTMKSE